MKNVIKENKISIIILSIVLAILVGYFVYDIYIDNPKEQKPLSKNVTGFFEVNNLINNKYIKKIETIEREKYLPGEEDGINNTMIKINNNKVLVADDLFKSKTNLIAAKGIKGTPKYVYYSSVDKVSNTMFIVLTKEGDLYYSNTNYYNEKDLEALEVKEFKKINTTKILNIYSFYQDKNISYPSLLNTIYAETETGNLLKVYNGKISSTYEQDWPYPDIICGTYNSIGCEGLNISPDKHLFNSYINDNRIWEEIKYKDKPIIVKDAFSIAIEKYITKDNVLTKEIEGINYYIISKDNILYQIPQNTNSQIESIKKVNAR